MTVSTGAPIRAGYCTTLNKLEEYLGLCQGEAVGVGHRLELVEGCRLPFTGCAH
jgi:hypothetical protein